MKKIINRNNRCIWDSGVDFHDYDRCGLPNSGLGILGIDGSEKESPV